MFPNNAAEQEWYHITNVLKKLQCISIHQFVQHVEQLNSYIVQLPCWFYSPSAKPSIIPMNVLFTEADLANHVLWMCPQMRQDQFNFHKKGMMCYEPYYCTRDMCTKARYKGQVRARYIYTNVCAKQ
jgi:hypothetical protein